MKRITKHISGLINALQNIILTMLPQGKIEQCIFAISFLFYLALGFLWQYHIDQTQNFSLFGYDTYGYTIGEALIPYKLLFFKLRHPLFAFWLFPISLIAFLPKWLLGIASVLPVFTIASNIAISLSISLVWRICAYLNPNSIKGNIVFVFLYFSFAQIMILSFAVESFTFSSLALLAYIVYAWLPQRRMNDYEQNIFFALIAGITLTNGAKFILAQWQTSKGLFAQFYSMIKASLLFICLSIIGLTVAIIRWYYVIFPADPNMNLIKHLIGDTTNYILQSSPMQVLKEIGYNMGVSSILFSIGSLHEELMQTQGHLITEALYIWGIPLFFLYGVALYSLWVNRRNSIIIVIIKFLIIDCFVHIIMGYGINEGWIFAGHWLFIFPIALSLITHNIRNYIFRKSYYLLVFLFSLFLFIHNISYLLIGIVNF